MKKILPAKRLLRTAVLLVAVCTTTAKAQVHPALPVDTLCYDDELHVKLTEVTVTGVTGQSLLRESPLPFAVLSGREVAETGATNIVSALTALPGVAALTTGAAIAKPVIRGLGYNRVAVVSDGIRQEGQQWGDEHGVEIDAMTIASAEVIKGPASLMYGSDALAGVVVLHPHPILPPQSMRLNVTLAGHTNNGLMEESVNYAGHRGAAVWDLRLTRQDAHAYRNHRDGYVPGTQFAGGSVYALIGVNEDWGHAHLRLALFEQTPGIPEGERSPLTGRLLPTAKVDSDGDASPRSYSKSLPYQDIRHYKAVWDFERRLTDDTRLLAIVGWQQNSRKEMEESDEPELYFLMNTLQGDLRLHTRIGAAWQLSTGIGTGWQQSENRGEEALIPAYHQLDGALFATATYTADRWNVSGGLRYDHRWLHSKGSSDAQFSDFHRRMDALTGSLGLTYCINQATHLRLNVAHGFRAPNMSELAANGRHEGALRYERGNANLQPEHSWQIDAALDYSSHLLTAQLSVFANHISHFVYLHRTGTTTGTDALPLYTYHGGNARLWGGEATVVVHPIAYLHIENTLSAVYTHLLHGQPGARHLPTTPPARWTASLRADLLRRCRHLDDSYAAIESVTHFRQGRIYSVGDTETATPSYTMLRLKAGTKVMRRGLTLFSLTLTADNLLNRSYQSHLSRLKYADYNVVTGRQGVADMGRNIALKVNIPINL